MKRAACSMILTSKELVLILLDFEMKKCNNTNYTYFLVENGYFQQEIRYNKNGGDYIGLYIIGEAIL